MRAALVRRGAPAELVEGGLLRLRELGYIDDDKLAAERASSLFGRGYGALRIRADLLRRGTEVGAVEPALPSVREEAARGERLLAERRARERVWDGEARRRALRWLAGRGFRPAALEILGELLGAGSETDGTDGRE